MHLGLAGLAAAVVACGGRTGLDGFGGVRNEGKMDCACFKGDPNNCGAQRSFDAGFQAPADVVGHPTDAGAAPAGGT